MPTYEARCTRCGHEYTFISSIKDCMNVPLCPDCGAEGKRIHKTSPMGFVKGKFEPFTSPVDGTIICNERDLRNHNARNGVVNMHEGYSEEQILSGAMKPKAPTKEEQIKDLTKDIGAAVQDLNSGYKPIKETTYEELNNGWN